MTAAKGKYIAAVIIYGTIGMTLRYISPDGKVRDSGLLSLGLGVRYVF